MLDLSEHATFPTSCRTFQVAPHYYATVIIMSGVSIQLISERLDQNNLATTNHHLNSFEDDQKKEIAKHVIVFKSKSSD